MTNHGPSKAYIWLVPIFFISLIATFELFTHNNEDAEEIFYPIWQTNIKKHTYLSENIVQKPPNQEECWESILASYFVDSYMLYLEQFSIAYPPECICPISIGFPEIFDDSCD